MHGGMGLNHHHMGTVSATGTDILRGPAEVFHSPLHLHHQSRSFPPRLQRTPSISSQSSVDSAPSRHSVSGIKPNTLPIKKKFSFKQILYNMQM